jgi:excisionase family DNA binding protein
MQSPAFADTDLLTKQDLARYLGVDVRTIERMVADRSCPTPTVIGSAKRWRWVTIRRWIEAIEFLQHVGVATIADTKRQSATSAEDE